MCKFYVKVWLSNLQKYDYNEDLTWDEAQRVQTNHRRKHRYASIGKHRKGGE